MPGTFDGTAIEWIADADSRFGPTFEAIIGGRYGLMPFDEVEWIRSEGPRDLRDMIWYPVQIGFRNGQSGAAFLPARYPGTDTDGTNDQKLARVTDWQEREWGDAGIGQRLWTLSDGTDKGIFELRNLEFD
nr:type VI secretion system accessory protein TagJ [Novosphingobium marinum]